MNLWSFFLNRSHRAFLPPVAIFVACLSCAQAQPTIVSMVPTNFATGVSPTGAVVFTFSEEMDTALTVAQFFGTMPFAILQVTSSWSAGNKVLTCVPTPAFPANQLIAWSVMGENLPGDPLEGDNTSGFFTTSSGGGGGTGSGTNRLTAFSVGKVHFYNQTSSAAPSLDPDAPYNFSATTTLASNRSATSVTLTVPTSALSNLTQNFLQPESFFLFSTGTNLVSFNSTFPSGNYVFNVIAASSNEMVTVNLLGTLVQPNAPHTTNFAAAQTVNPAQPFTLGWDAFQGGTAADFIYVSVGNVFKTPDAGKPGALSGTATSVVIPAGTLQAGSNYNTTIGFYRATTTSNASYTTSAYLATSTDFTLMTSGGGATSSLIFTNISKSGGAFSFDIDSSVGQFFIVEYSATMLTNQWQLLLTTNSVTGRLRIIHPATNEYLFYRARKIP